MASDAAKWDAEFALWLGSAISRYLAEHPPPGGTQYAADARDVKDHRNSPKVITEIPHPL